MTDKIVAAVCHELAPDENQLEPDLPFVPGGEAAGVISKVGADVQGIRAGDEVAVGMRFGAYAEAVDVPAGAVSPKPPAMNFAKAASYQTAYLAAYVALDPVEDEGGSR